MKKFVSALAGVVLVATITAAPVAQAGKAYYGTACLGGTYFRFDDAPAGTATVSVTSGRRNKGTVYASGDYLSGVTLEMTNGGDCNSTNPLYANWMSSTGRILYTKQWN